MRKCYIEKAHPDKPVFWEGFLGKQDPETVFDLRYNKYVPKFDRFIPEGAAILEGGCGLGQYLWYYTRRRFSVTGVDFSSHLVEKSARLNTDAVVRTADIRKLPFDDDSFDVYILNGVLEHFEEGPGRALAEAERVLRKGGILIATLQYVNAARALADRLRFGKKGAMKRYHGATIEGSYKVVDGFALEEKAHFHSYFFDRREARDLFRKNDFEILHLSPLSVENGLGDFRLFRTVLTKRGKKKAVRTQRHEESGKRRSPNGAGEWLKNTFIQEEPKDVLGRAMVRVLQICFGSMILVVCRKR
jgi:SAM-dependent methyltransferase